MSKSSSLGGSGRSWWSCGRSGWSSSMCMLSWVSALLSASCRSERARMACLREQAWQNQGKASKSPLTRSRYCCLVMPDWQTRCCHRLQPSHWRHSCRWRHSCEQKTQLLDILDTYKSICYLCNPSSLMSAEWIARAEWLDCRLKPFLYSPE